jgi:hypothetical protein
MVVARQNNVGSDALNFQLTTLNFPQWADIQDQKRE